MRAERDQIRVERDAARGERGELIRERDEAVAAVAALGAAAAAAAAAAGAAGIGGGAAVLVGARSPKPLPQLNGATLASDSLVSGEGGSVRGSLASGEGELVRGSPAPDGAGGATPPQSTELGPAGLQGVGRPGLQGVGRLQRIVELEVKIAALTAADGR